MPKYLAKLSRFGGQYRITLPRGLIKEVAWDKVEYVTLGPQIDNCIIIRRFADGESFKSDPETNPPGPD